MRYIDLGQQEARAGRGIPLDIDGDGNYDFMFYIVHIGDPLAQVDKIRFLAGSAQHYNLLVSGDNESPVIDQGDLIRNGNNNPYEWYDISEVTLAEKIIGLTGPPYWQGNWKNASHKFLAIQVMQGNLRYTGWIELSLDTIEEKVILHRAAVSTEPGKDVKAGL